MSQRVGSRKGGVVMRRSQRGSGEKWIEGGASPVFLTHFGASFGHCNTGRCRYLTGAARLPGPTAKSPVKKSGCRWAEGLLNRSMKVVILCGGLGTRLREETEYRPKPMVPIGGRPILWHIMKNYAWHGFRRSEER